MFQELGNELADLVMASFSAWIQNSGPSLLRFQLFNDSSSIPLSKSIHLSSESITDVFNANAIPKLKYGRAGARLKLPE